MTAATECPGCVSLRDSMLLAAAVGVTPRALRCLVCGAMLTPPGASMPSRKRTLPQNLVPAFVHAVLRLAAQRERGDAPAGRTFVDASSGRSSVCSVISQLELGVVGDGCSGTRGTWRGDRGEPLEVQGAPVLLAPDALAESERRYAGLDAKARATAEAVIADGKGDGVVLVPLCPERPEERTALTLAQRVALRLADAATAKRWAKHAAMRDAGPLLVGSAEMGEARLIEAAKGWWGA